MKKLTALLLALTMPLLANAASEPNIDPEVRVNWGSLFNEFGDNSSLNSKKLKEKVAALMTDDDVTKKSGIYEYVLRGDERVLNIRAFSLRDRRTAYKKQKGICPK